MSGISFTTPTVPKSDDSLSGGLNSSSGGLGRTDSESTDLQNIDFNKFGSVLKRGGYSVLNTNLVTGSPYGLLLTLTIPSSTSTITTQGDGLWWYEFNNAGTPTRFAIYVSGGKVYKMDDLDGTWDDITGSLTITALSHCDFDNFLNEVYITNGTDLPFKWNGSGNATTMSVPPSLTTAKYVKQFNNYLFLANVKVSGTTYPSRLYWSNIKDTTTWGGANFIEISKDDGQQITGLKVLSDRLVIFKERAIYNLFFTGDNDIPFVLPGGGKSNSAVGTIAPFSIQEVENGLVFLSYDGFYYYDGNNGYKISDKINSTVIGLNLTLLSQSVSLVQKNKTRYMCAVPPSAQNNNTTVCVWDWYNNAWSLYAGISASAMATFFVNGNEERPYFSDYVGFTYRMDTGHSDYPSSVETAINAYYYTNWKFYDDLCDQKGVPHIYIYYQTSNSILTLAYSYDFEVTDTYSQTFSIATGTAVYGVAIYDIDVYSGSGGAVTRRDLTGRGRVVRFKFANNNIGETFQIDGFGSYPHLETNV